MLMVQHIQSSTYSEDAVRQLFPVLAQSTVYGTPPVVDRHGVLLSEMLSYTTLNEEYVVQKTIANHQAKKKAEATAWRLGVGILGTLMGMGDGFQIGDAIGGLALGAIAGKVSDALQEGDELKLQEFGLEWVNDPSSYLYHRKRHRGDAVRRLLMLLPHPQTGVPCTFFGVQFPDGYVAHLAFVPQQSEVNSPVNGMFCMTDCGFGAELLPQKQILGEIACNSGQKLPVEFWTNGSSDHLVVIPHKAPHHSLY